MVYLYYQFYAVFFRLFRSYVRRKYGKKLEVIVANPLVFNVGTKQKELHFQEDRVARPVLRKNNAHHFVLTWPTSGF